MALANGSMRLGTGTRAARLRRTAMAAESMVVGRVTGTATASDPLSGPLLSMEARGSTSDLSPSFFTYEERGVTYCPFPTSGRGQGER
jgi:hypothetical protein